MSSSSVDPFGRLLDLLSGHVAGGCNLIGIAYRDLAELVPEAVSAHTEREAELARLREEVAGLSGRLADAEAGRRILRETHVRNRQEVDELRDDLSNAEGARQQGWNEAHRLRRELRAANERADGLAQALEVGAERAAAMRSACERLANEADFIDFNLLSNARKNPHGYRLRRHVEAAREAVAVSQAAARQPAPPATKECNSYYCALPDGHAGEHTYRGDNPADIHDHRAEAHPQPDAGPGGDALDMAKGRA